MTSSRSRSGGVGIGAKKTLDGVGKKNKNGGSTETAVELDESKSIKKTKEPLKKKGFENQPKNNP